MSYKYQQRQFFEIGIGIDEIINSQVAKDSAKQRWKIIQEYKRFNEEKLEEQYVKDCAWWEKYSQETMRYFIKYGDRFPILGWMRTHKKEIIFVILTYGLILRLLSL